MSKSTHQNKDCVEELLISRIHFYSYTKVFYSDSKVKVHNYNIIASLITLRVKMSKNTEQNKVLFYK